ncbi:hypothetical protein HYH03_014413 [Edaphochlamys debaryana]|uniref:Ribosomal RNA-processing protein 40 n=1 Tax=Edaphochlamys debaryana TaxID=47281 RepID=A0A835XNR0_9CHLO|nr:hypothetical protein HYH03_014413 [Edaphochlamys debaryana]|eukprot:KAG2486914.1 hypothetical protein HYH03_014413 [Edaphochlamys debaryana]
MSAAPVGKVVGPGDKVLDIPAQGTLRLSAGLTTHEGGVVSTKGGVLRSTRNGQYFLEGRQKRYIPAEADVVVGTVVDKHSENFMVDIGGPFNAVLPQLSFEGATRRNRPNISSGDLVYGRVVSAHRDTDPVLSCTDSAGRAAGFGHLKGGMVLQVSTSLARQLLGSPTAPVLEALGGGLQFEMAVGLNGRVWLSAPTAATAVLVANAIAESEFKTPTQVRTMVARYLSAVG